MVQASPLIVADMIYHNTQYTCIRYYQYRKHIEPGCFQLRYTQVHGTFSSFDGIWQGYSLPQHNTQLIHSTNTLSSWATAASQVHVRSSQAVKELLCIGVELWVTSSMFLCFEEANKISRTFEYCSNRLASISFQVAKYHQRSCMYHALACIVISYACILYLQSITACTR